MRLALTAFILSLLTLTLGACNAKPVPPRTDLFTGVATNDLGVVNGHIAAGSDLNITNPNGDTPLHVAAFFGHIDIARALADAGATLEAKNNNSSTPLFNAAFFCHPDTLTALIDAGANPNATDANGTPIIDILKAPWPDIRPIYETIYTLVGVPFDADRIENGRAGIIAILSAT